MKIVVLVSANAEWSAVRSLLPAVVAERTLFGECFDAELDGWPVTFFHGGWGKVSAAATAQYVIDQMQPDLLVNLGTCGGLRGQIENGIIILVDKTIIYDIVEQMSDADEAIEHYTTELDLGWLPRVTPTPVLRGPILSADRDIVRSDVPELIRKYGAVAADWESGAIAWVARRNNQRLLILRAVSDIVGEDDDELYGDYGQFVERSREVMRRLLEALPKWLVGIDKVQHGYRV